MNVLDVEKLLERQLTLFHRLRFTLPAETVEIHAHT
jgi:hypothetical protein